MSTPNEAVHECTGNMAESVHDESLSLPIDEPSEHTYIHPDAARLFKVAPWMQSVPLAGSAIAAFGPKCVAALGVVYLLIKGIGDHIVSYSMYPMFMKRYKVKPEVYQRMSGISSMGFSIKALTATFSDTIACFGYTKRWYMTLSCIAGVACTIVYGVLPAAEVSAMGAAGVIFIAKFCTANVDVLSEGHYSRLLKLHPLPGANLISWIWAAIMIGTMVASAIQGPVSDGGLPQVGIFISAGMQAVCAIFFVFNWYGEKTNRSARAEDYDAQLALLAAGQSTTSSVPFDSSDFVALDETKHIGSFTLEDSPQQHFQPLPESDQTGNMELVCFDELRAANDLGAVGSDSQGEVDPFKIPSCCCGVWEVNSEMITRNAAVVSYGILMALGVIVLAVLTIVADTYQLLYGCVVISVVLCVTGFFCIPLTIMKANLFGWFQLTVYILIPGALDNFYMADSECVPMGPQFSQTFYNIISAIIGNCAGLVGVYLFAHLCTKRSYRLTLIITTLVQVVASVFDLIILKRWNVYIGIPDHAMYILGDAVVYQVCYMLSYMPMNMLISRLCPKGCESTMFAILASFSNLGASTSSTIGAILMETVWPINLTSKPCNFDNVMWLVITGHLLTPLLAIPAAFLLVPGTRMCDEIDPKLVEAVPILQQWLNKYLKPAGSAPCTPCTCAKAAATPESPPSTMASLCAKESD